MKIVTLTVVLVLLQSTLCVLGQIISGMRITGDCEIFCCSILLVLDSLIC